MNKTNGLADASPEVQLKDGQKTGQAKPEPIQMKDETNKPILEPELPVADPTDGFEEKNAADAAGPVAVPENDQQKLRAERDELFDRLARLQAEFDNYRKRSAKESADYRDYAVADAAKALLPVMDSFNLALKNAGAKPEDLRKGVELIYKQFQDVLQKINVERVPAQGELFDPRVHEAIEMVETDAAPDQHVFEELQPGYRIKGRLLRPAMVRVARNSNKGNA